MIEWGTTWTSVASSRREGEGAVGRSVSFKRKAELTLSFLQLAICPFVPFFLFFFCPVSSIVSPQEGSKRNEVERCWQFQTLDSCGIDCLGIFMKVSSDVDMMSLGHKAPTSLRFIPGNIWTLQKNINFPFWRQSDSYFSEVSQRVGSLGAACL